MTWEFLALYSISPIYTSPCPTPWSYPKSLIHILLIRISYIIENREREEERAKEEPDLSDLPRLCTSTYLIHSSNL
jgi:hypothetical protein